MPSWRILHLHTSSKLETASRYNWEPSLDQVDVPVVNHSLAENVTWESEKLANGIETLSASAIYNMLQNRTQTSYLRQLEQ
jgi:hypothetical protein